MKGLASAASAVSPAPTKPKAPPPFPWTDAVEARLAELWAQTDPQLSTAQIGRLLGTTKNAVIGKAGRLGLPGRPSPIRPKPKLDAAPAARRRHSRPAGNSRPWPGGEDWEDTPFPAYGAPKPAPRLVVVPPPAPLPRPRQPSLLRPQDGCRWIDGDPQHPWEQWRYCDAPRSGLGGSWCDEHRLRVFLRPEQEAG